MPQLPAVTDGKVRRLPQYKVNDADFKRAQRLAKRRKTDVAKVLRRFLKAYANGEVTI